ncbi:MAG: hypothetical protein K2H85_12015 [Allobaculum sp.]|nr:hypothetical protein [Allobaculum sp.]
MDKKNETQEASSSRETLSSEALEGLQNEAQQELTNKPFVKEDSTQPLKDKDTPIFQKEEENSPTQEQTTGTRDEPLFATVDGESVEETILGPEET